MDAAKIESWLLNEKDIHESNVRVAYPSCLRRPKPGISTTAYPNRDWTNPNRFSDPLNRSTHLSSSLGLSLPGRPNKAYTWYLDNDLPWRLTAARARTGHEDRMYSLFGNPGWKPVSSADGDVGRRKRRNGASFTWERVRQQERECSANRRSNTLETRSTTFAASGRLSPHMLSKRATLISPNGSRHGRSSPINNAYGTHLNSPRSCSPCGSKRSSLSPNRHVLGSHLTGSQHSSPNGSQRSSPNRSPQGTLTRLIPGLLPRYSPNSRLSPTQHSILGTSFGGSLYGASQRSSPKSSFVSQWVSNSSSSFSARSSQTSSGREDGDLSYGSETDDDFFYISCKQLSQGLADLSMTSTKTAIQTQTNRVVENPTFVLPEDSEYVDDDDDCVGCSDDALSDDVFLDNPQPSEMSKRSLQESTDFSEHELNAEKEEQNGITAEQDDENSSDSVGHPAVESLRRNSLQSKLRQTWRHRRNKAASQRAGKIFRKTGHASAETSSENSPSAESQSYNTAMDDQTACASSAVDEESTSGPSEAKPCYYYVISPTDDVNMPDVIAVRRSSVELIRWQNSLRRRRRRQAKRHDLGRNKKKEPKQSATV